MITTRIDVYNNNNNYIENENENWTEETPLLLPPTSRALLPPTSRATLEQEQEVNQEVNSELNQDRLNPNSLENTSTRFLSSVQTSFKNAVENIKAKTGNQYSCTSINPHSPESIANRIKCWACWEPQTNHRKNPLIRVCRGCKDPELQYIHQECINSYISSLPLPRRPRSPRTTGTSQQLPTTAQQFLNENSDTEDLVYYYCTRCRDPYVVTEVEISPFYVIWDDLWLRFIAIILGIGFLLITITLITVAINVSQGGDVVIIEIAGFPITALMITFLLTIFGMGAGGSLLAAMWISSSGRKRLFVKGTPLSESSLESIV